jgi:hypothetical protein
MVYEAGRQQDLYRKWNFLGLAVCLYGGRGDTEDSSVTSTWGRPCPMH